MFALTEQQNEAISDWIVNELHINTAIYGDQATKQSKPLAIIRVLFPPSPETLKPSTVGVSDTETKKIFHEVFTLSIMVKDNEGLASSLCKQLMQSLYKKAVKSALNAVGLHYRYSHPIVDVSKPLSSRTEYESSIDFKFGCSSEFTEERTIIETIEISYDGGI